MSISPTQRKAVIERSGDCCEYCRLASVSVTIPFHVDHVIPIKHGGTDDFENLCFACFKCNAHKGYDLTGFDPLTSEITRLYHPRQQRWEEHFTLEDNLQIIGITAEGRTTVQLLQINNEERIEHRQILAELGEYPCIKD
ncbi:MAG: HNH endonuclease signature motif containing protein [bacterium]|nr:HNH endonuclease signature motif containing protein [bacterium]